MNGSFNNFSNAMPFFDAGYLLKREYEKRTLKKLGVYTAGAILLCIFLQNVMILTLHMFGLYDRYFSDAYFSSAVDILISVAGMLVPFLIFGKKMKKVSGIAQPLMLEKPEKKLLMLPAVLAGLGFCMIGNIVNSYISAFFSSVNVEISSPDVPMADGVTGVIVTFFRVALTAAIVEELSFRGFVMGNLRFFGDGFAIVVSSVMFALLHGNMVQSPFALMAGVALGYLSVKTDSLWTGIIIHALNNSFSMLVYYLTKQYGQEEIVGLYVLLVYGTILAGMLSFMIVAVRTRKRPLLKGGSVLTSGEKIKAYFLNFPMLSVIAYMLYVTAEYINPGS